MTPRTDRPDPGLPPLLGHSNQRPFGLRAAFSLALWSSLCICTAAAQSIPPERPRARPASELTGWADWEKAAEIWQRVEVPPAPILTPEQAHASFRVAPGYRVELVAAEPMVANPIFFEFDPRGRIWAVEYRGYMRDLEGTGEGDPICRIVVLEDTDADGRADRSTVFLDQLVMPRSLSFVQGGVLVAEPPNLWFCEDTDGDLRCDRKRQVGAYGVAGNPQHTANGLRYGIDNWLHSADWGKRHRWRDGRIEEQDTVHRGQFGVSFDDFGRFITCHESSALHMDLLPAEYLLRNRAFHAVVRRGRNANVVGAAVNIARGAAEVYPIRPTPQITLGALELRDDGRLRTYTVVSGTCFYDGHQFPTDAYGNAFVPEAGGHLIGRLRLEGDLIPRASRVYPPETELLASTDERFRPVNARVGPDGALYIADMYHGIIEHVIFLAPYLTEQIKARALETGNDMGRIWRIVATDRPLDRAAPRLDLATPAELVGHLSHPNGWHRITAQRLLIERGATGVIAALETALRSRAAPASRAPDTHALGRMHALWTLDGLNALTDSLVSQALTDPHPFVRATTCRLSERFAGQTASATPWIARLEAVAGRDASELVRLHALLALGAFRGAAAEPALMGLADDLDSPLRRTALLTGLADRELAFLVRLLATPAWQNSAPARGALLGLLAETIMERRQSAEIGRLLDLIQDQREPLVWRREPLLDGLLAAAPADLSRFTPVRLEREPRLVASLENSPDAALRERARRLHALVTWPGDSTLRAAAVDLAPLSEEQQALLKLGEATYALTCGACHQPHGAGLADVAPPLAGSTWVHGPTDRLIRIALHGLYGPLVIDGKSWNHHMPGFREVLDDDQIAGVLTYARRAWGNRAEPVASSAVAAIRADTAARQLPWTAAELEPAGAAAGDSANPNLPAPARPDPQGEIRLHASHAITHGRRLAYRPALDILAPWRHEQDIAEWRIESPGGSYTAHILLAADDASAGDTFRLETETAAIDGVIQSTGAYDQFKEFVIGRIELQPGLTRLILRPAGPLRAELADVRALRLTPIR